MRYHEFRASDVLQAVREFVVTEESTNPMLRPLSNEGSVCLRVRESGRREFALHQIEAPFAVIGRSSKSDITLSGSGVSYRHAYLQILSGRLFCVDLGSKTGLYWGKRRRAYGWLAPEETLKIGSYKLALASREGTASLRTDGDEYGENPLDVDKSRIDRLPEYLLEIWDGSDEAKRQPVDRILSLVGRWRSCPVHLPDASVSHVHCSLVLTESGLWAIDLLGKNGLTVNQQAARAALLEHGDKVRIGRYSIRIHRREISEDLHRNDPEEDVAQHSQAAKIPETPGSTEESTTQADVADSVGIDTALWDSEPRVSDWLGTLFQIEHIGNALVVLPNISGGSFRYAQLQAESNSLRRMLDNPIHHNLIVDLQGLNYIGSEAIGVVIGLARRATDRGGRVAFCHASPNVHTVMQNMGLLRLWPYFATRKEALNNVSAE